MASQGGQSGVEVGVAHGEREASTFENEQQEQTHFRRRKVLDPNPHGGSL